MIVNGRTAEAFEAIAALRARDASDLRPLLLEAYLRLQIHEYTQAAVLSQAILEKDPWSVEACLLLGLLAKQRDDNNDAVTWFKRAIYAKPDCWPAHFYLGELLRVAGEADQARREYRVTLLQMGTDADPDGGLLLPLRLPVGDIRFLCNLRVGSADDVPDRLFSVRGKR
ncbi:MAG: hypothetical protein HQL33_06400 [Alphaproteobacteria bacterium]|nr:hypothetical protein [Alphaproteobacteria bacterium]